MGLRGPRAVATGSLERVWAAFFDTLHEKEETTFEFLCRARSGKEVCKIIGLSKFLKVKIGKKGLVRDPSNTFGGLPINLGIYGAQFVKARNSPRYPKLKKHWRQRAKFYGKWMARLQVGYSSKTERSALATKPGYSVILGTELTKRLGKSKARKLKIGVTGVGNREPDLDEYYKNAERIGSLWNEYWQWRRIELLYYLAGLKSRRAVGAKNSRDWESKHTERVRQLVEWKKRLQDRGVDMREEEIRLKGL